MHINWKQLVAVVVKVALKGNPTTAPIADEVSTAAAEIEVALGPGTGAEKRAHVLNVAREAAQAVDELKGSPDEVAGHVSNALTAGIEAANEIKAAAKPAA